MAISTDKLVQSVGARLKQARVNKCLSLDEISARTRINSKNLASIEGDVVNEFSSPFFYRSFVRQYAEQVDIDFQVLAAGVETLAESMRQPELPGRGKPLPVRVAPMKIRPKRDLSWIVSSGLFLGFVVVGSGAYAGWKYYGPLVHRATQTATVLPAQEGGRNNPSDLPKAVEAARQEPLAAPLKRQPKGIREPVLPADESTAAVQLATPAETIHLELAAIERTWLSVSADGKQAYRGILEPTQVKILDGLQFATLRTGNAGGVNITFNGKEIGPIGPRGKSRTVVFTKTGYTVRTSEVVLIPADHIGG